MARVRNAIIEHFKGKAEWVVMIDDDVTRIGRHLGIKKTKHYLDSNDVDEFIERGATMAEECGCSVFGMNMLPDTGAYRQYTPFSFTNCVLGPFMAVRTDTPLRFDERLSLKEDYDFSIQAMRRDRRVLRFNQYFYEVKHLNLTGGCAFYRTSTKEVEQMKIFRSKWGTNVVRVDRMKANATARKRLDTNPVVRIPIMGC